MNGKAGLAAIFSVFLTVSPLHAEVVLQDVGWQLALQVKKQQRNYHDIKRWLFPPTDKAKIRVRAKGLLVNRSSKEEAALLLRYSFGARLRRIGSDDLGIWTVPFHLEELRITTLKAHEKKEVEMPINRAALNAYLKRMFRAGYWPDAFKVNVMIEPREGEGFAQRTGEVVLPVIWSTSSSKASDNERP